MAEYRGRDLVHPESRGGIAEEWENDEFPDVADEGEPESGGSVL